MPKVPKYQRMPKVPNPPASPEPLAMAGVECLKPALVRLVYVCRYSLYVILNLTFEYKLTVIGLGQGGGILSILKLNWPMVIL